MNSLERAGVLCACGHIEENHFVYTSSTTKCADFHDLGCDCSYMRVKDGTDGNECMCGHRWQRHHFGRTPVSYCDGFKLEACMCERFREVQVNGVDVVVREKDTFTPIHLADEISELFDRRRISNNEKGDSHDIQQTSVTSVSSVVSESEDQRS